MTTLTLILALVSPLALAGGSHYGTPDGSVWVTLYGYNKLVQVDLGSRRVLREVKLPTQGAGIRKMIVDAQGQLWYMGSQNGRLGRVR